MKGRCLKIRTYSTLLFVLLGHCLLLFHLRKKDDITPQPLFLALDQHTKPKHECQVLQVMIYLSDLPNLNELSSNSTASPKIRCEFVKISASLCIFITYC